MIKITKFVILGFTLIFSYAEKCVKIPSLEISQERTWTMKSSPPGISHVFTYQYKYMPDFRALGWKSDEWRYDVLYTSTGKKINHQDDFHVGNYLIRMTVRDMTPLTSLFSTEFCCIFEFSITDADECSLGPSHPMAAKCPEFTDCVNTPGAYECRCRDPKNVYSEELKKLQAEHEQALEEREKIQAEIIQSLEEVIKFQGEKKQTVEEIKKLEAEKTQAVEEMKRLQAEKNQALEATKKIQKEKEKFLEEIKKIQRKIEKLSEEAKKLQSKNETPSRCEDNCESWSKYSSFITAVLVVLCCILLRLLLRGKQLRYCQKRVEEAIIQNKHLDETVMNLNEQLQDCQKHVEKATIRNDGDNKAVMDLNEQLQYFQKLTEEATIQNKYLNKTNASLDEHSSFKKQWKCPFCTLINPAQAVACECCCSLKTEIYREEFQVAEVSDMAQQNKVDAGVNFPA